MDDKADIRKAVRTEGCLRPGVGAVTKPIRKRGYHRALRRGESWALCEKAFRDIKRDINRQLYSELVYKDNPLMGLFEFLDSEKTVPIIYGKR